MPNSPSPSTVPWAWNTAWTTDSPNFSARAKQVALNCSSIHSNHSLTCESETPSRGVSSAKRQLDMSKATERGGVSKVRRTASAPRAPRSAIV